MKKRTKKIAKMYWSSQSLFYLKGDVGFFVLVGVALIAFVLAGGITTFPGVNYLQGGNLITPIPLYNSHTSEQLHTLNFITFTPAILPTQSQLCGSGTAIALDATSKKSDDSVSSISWNHTTITSCGNVLIVGITLSDATGRGRFDIGSITYNGINLTKLASLDGPLSSIGSYHTEMWYLTAAPVGTHAIVATLRSLASGALPDAVAGAETFYNVNSINPLGTPVTSSGNNSPAVITVPSIPNQVIVDIVGGNSNGSLTNDPSQTKLWYDNVQPNQIGTTGASSSKPATSTMTTMQWNNISSWATIGIPINP